MNTVQSSDRIYENCKLTCNRTEHIVYPVLQVIKFCVLGCNVALRCMTSSGRDFGQYTAEIRFLCEEGLYITPRGLYIMPRGPSKSNRGGYLFVTNLLLHVNVRLLQREAENENRNQRTTHLTAFANTILVSNTTAVVWTCSQTVRTLACKSTWQFSLRAIRTSPHRDPMCNNGQHPYMARKKLIMVDSTQLQRMRIAHEFYG